MELKSQEGFRWGLCATQAAATLTAPLSQTRGTFSCLSYYTTSTSTCKNRRTWSCAHVSLATYSVSSRKIAQWVPQVRVCGSHQMLLQINKILSVLQEITPRRSAQRLAFHFQPGWTFWVSSEGIKTNKQSKSNRGIRVTLSYLLLKVVFQERTEHRVRKISNLKASHMCLKSWWDEGCVAKPNYRLRDAVVWIWSGKGHVMMLGSWPWPLGLVL